MRQRLRKYDRHEINSTTTRKRKQYINYKFIILHFIDLFY